MPAAKWRTRPARIPRGKTVALDAFVCDSSNGKTKRLNAEILAAPHARVKSGCALEGWGITQVVIELLEKRFRRNSIRASHCRMGPPRQGLE